MDETVASGMVPWSTFIGAEKGSGEDRRWQKVGADYFQWTAKHDAHLRTRRSIANIGVVMGQSTQLLYPGPGAAGLSTSRVRAKLRRPVRWDSETASAIRLSSPSLRGS